MNHIDLFTEAEKKILSKMNETRLLKIKKEFFKTKELIASGYICPICEVIEGKRKFEYERDNKIFLQNREYIMNLLEKFNKPKKGESSCEAKKARRKP